MPGIPPHRASPGEPRVVALTAEGEPAYERFVSNHPHALFYYSLRFRNFLVGLLGCQHRYATCVVGDEVTGVMPMMVTDGPHGRILNSLPFFGSNGDILAADDASWATLAQWYQTEATASGVAAATVVANPLADHRRVPVVADLEDGRIGHVTFLEGGEDPAGRLFGSVAGSARRNIRKALGSGVQVHVDNDALDALERLHRESMSFAGGRTKEPEFFGAVSQHLRPGEDYDLYLATRGTVVGAALLVLYYAAAVEYYLPAASPPERSSQPMAALLHRAMSDSASRGFRLWNWGGSWLSQDNLMRFKAKWGGQPRPYRYLTKVNNPALREMDALALLHDYPGFYVLPFSSLHPSGDAAEVSG